MISYLSLFVCACLLLETEIYLENGTLVCVVQSKSVLLNLLLRFDHHPCTEEMPESEYESLSDQFRYVLRKTLAEIPRHILANDCIPQKKKKKK